MSNLPPSRARNLSYAVVAGQSGCLTLVIIVVALFLGIWLDAQFGVRGPFTIGLLLLSIPVSLFFMVRLALSAVRMIQPPPASKTQNSGHTKED
jgi:F0F1-type ATP synthase assembly protein I